MLFCMICALTNFYFKTTCIIPCIHVRPHALGSMGGLKIEGLLYHVILKTSMSEHRGTREHLLWCLLASTYNPILNIVQLSWTSHGSLFTRQQRPNWLQYHSELTVSFLNDFPIFYQAFDMNVPFSWHGMFFCQRLLLGSAFLIGITW